GVCLSSIRDTLPIYDFAPMFGGSNRSWSSSDCPFLLSFRGGLRSKVCTLSLHDALPICRPTSCPPVEVEPLEVQPDRRDLRSHRDRKSTRLNSSHVKISYAVFCLKKKITRRTVGLLPSRHCVRSGL